VGNRSSTGVQLARREDTNSALRVLPGNLRVGRGRNTQHALVLLDPAGPALREDVPGLARGLDLGDHDLVDLAARDLAVPARFHLRVKRLVRSARQDARVAETSSIRRPRKAR
jgi:hypothetical protein